MSKEKTLNQNLSKIRIGLYVTCLVELIRPSIAWATINLLESSNCKVIVPEAQTCCGQPAYNAGAKPQTAELAKKLIKEFEGFDYVVLPSGSCAGMIICHYPNLFQKDDPWQGKAKRLAEKTYELTTFLVNVLKKKLVVPVNKKKMRVTYHDSCSGLRELGIKKEPRKLLEAILGTELAEGTEAETCCGFGGLFCMKYPTISENIVDLKIDDILKTNADTVLGGDLGCLMNIAGRITRRGEKVGVRHIAEYLADIDELPPLGEK